MTKYVMAMTYLPKVAAVGDGTCTQTIRRDAKYSVGDEIYIQYEWVWRIKVMVTEVYNISVHERGYHDENDVFIAWDSGIADRLAERDHISPPTGEELSRVLRGYYPDDTTCDYQVIRWDVIA